MATGRGLTILEVVVALAIVALVAGTMSGALSLLRGVRDAESIKLAGFEAAHRLVVQFNEDPVGVAQAQYPVEVDGYWFDYDVRESVLEITEFLGTGRVRPESRSFADMRSNPTAALQNPLWRVEVVVYARESGGGFAAGEEVARLSRVYNLLGLDPDRLITLLLELLGEQLDREESR